MRARSSGVEGLNFLGELALQAGEAGTFCACEGVVFGAEAVARAVAGGAGLASGGSGAGGFLGVRLIGGEFFRGAGHGRAPGARGFRGTGRWREGTGPRERAASVGYHRGEGAEKF